MHIKLTVALLNYRGLYVLGAGASAGIIPFGKELVVKISDHYNEGGSYSADRPYQDRRTKWVINSSFKKPFELISGNELYNDLISRVSSGFVQLRLFHELTKPVFLNVVPNNYAVFQNFPSSVIINYNLDGLAEKFCMPKHRVITPHGTISEMFGSPLVSELLNDGEDIEAFPTNHILIEPEPIAVCSKLPLNIGAVDFVAIIGYTFGRNNIGFDDYYSFQYICKLLRLNPELSVFVIDPYPEFITETLKEQIKSKHIFSVNIFWNAYSEAIRLVRKNMICINKINEVYNCILDSGKLD